MNPRHAHDEVSGSTERFASWLVQRAARNSPPLLSQRLAEEWMADLAAQRPGLSRLRFAIGCCWATQVIAHDYVALSGAATSSATGRASIATFTARDSPLFSRRATVLVLIAAVHVLVIFAFANGLLHQVPEVPPQRFHTTFVSEPTTRDVPSQLPEPNMRTWSVTPPEPDLRFQFPADTTPPDDTASQVPQSPSTRLSLPKVADRVLGGPGQGFPNTDSYYPSASRRMGETGVATVRVCVDGNGRLASDPLIAQSSGSVRLDEGALRLAKAGSGHYRSTTEDGRAVSSCYPFRIRFELKP